MSKYTSIDFTNEKGAFIAAYEGAIGGLWSNAVANILPVTEEVVTYSSLGAVNPVRQWLGGRQERSPVPYTYTIQSKVYETSLTVPVDSYRRNQATLWEAKVAEMGQKFAFHYNQLLIDLISANGTGWDNVAFFAATHNVVDSGTQKNLITNADVASLDVNVAAAPTTAEMAAVILDTIGYMLTLKDEAGDSLNGNARGFKLLTSNPKVWASSMNAIAQNNLASNETNPLRALQDSSGFSLSTNLEPGLGAANSAVFYMTRTDSAVKPFIIQEESPVEFQICDDSSDLAKLQNRYMLGMKAVRGAGYGAWQYAVKATLS